MDEALSIALLGLPPSGIVELQSELVDDAGVSWRTEAVYRADSAGRVDVAEARPVSGAFDEAGVQGLFWSMRPDAPDGFSAFKERGPAPTELGSKRGHRLGLPELGDAAHRVRLTTRSGGRILAEVELTREVFASGIVERRIESDTVRGRLFEPEAGGPWPGVIMISGSGGGIYRQDAAMLAANGFSVLALAYFNYEDLPTHQLGVPLEYFENAFAWFQRHLGHDRIGITGPSKGGEGSFVVAANLPDLVKAVAPIVPGDLYLCAADANGTPRAAWTRAGIELPWAGTPDDWSLVPEALRVPKERILFNARANLEPFYARNDVYARAAIPIEKMRCPVLILYGEDDQAWPSKLAVTRALHRLEAANYAYPVECFTVAGAGHMFTFPGWPTTLCDSILHPLLPIYMTMGGSPAATARFQREGWRKLIEFFDRTLRGEKI